MDDGEETKSEYLGRQDGPNTTEFLDYLIRPGVAGVHWFGGSVEPLELLQPCA